MHVYKIYNLVAVFGIACVSYCKEAKYSLFSLYKHDMSHPICQHSFYRDPCGHKAVRHNYVCSEYTIYVHSSRLFDFCSKYFTSLTLISSY